MLNKSGHHSTPTFLEGISGFYQRRESPPNVPGTAPAFKQVTPTFASQFNNNATTPTFHTQYYRHQSNPGSSTQLHAVNFNNNNVSTHYVAQPSAYFGGQAPRPSASSTSLPMVASSVMGSMTAQTSAYIPQYTQNQQQAITPQRRLSHTPHGNRVAARSELSSHSFSSPRQLQVHHNNDKIQEKVLQSYVLASSIPQLIPQQGAIQLHGQEQQRYSVSSIPLVSNHQQHFAQGVKSGMELPRRVLTSSLSIGNVFQNEQLFNAPLGAFAFENNGASGLMHAKYQQRSNMHNESLRAASAGSAQSLSAIQQQQQHDMLRRGKVCGKLPAVFRKHGSASPSLYDSCTSDLPLPPNWEIDVTPDGYRYFIDHRNKRTTWAHPLAPENLPHGWTKIYDQLHGVVYFNEIERRSQFEHPGLNLHSASSSTNSSTTKKSNAMRSQQQQPNALADRIRQSASIQSIIQHQKQQFGNPKASAQPHHQSQPLPIYHSTNSCYLTNTESLNIITEDVPDWLKLYGEAPPQSDHLLNWNMFKLMQLQQFDEMLRKLYKQEVLNRVSKFERARTEINGELLRRFQRS